MGAVELRHLPEVVHQFQHIQGVASKAGAMDDDHLVASEGPALEAEEALQEEVADQLFLSEQDQGAVVEEQGSAVRPDWEPSQLASYWARDTGRRSLSLGVALPWDSKLDDNTESPPDSIAMAPSVEPLCSPIAFCGAPPPFSSSELGRTLLAALSSSSAGSCSAYLPSPPPTPSANLASVRQGHSSAGAPRADTSSPVCSAESLFSAAPSGTRRSGSSTDLPSF